MRQFIKIVTPRIESWEIVPKGVVASRWVQLDPQLNHNPSTEILLVTTKKVFRREYVNWVEKRILEKHTITLP